MKNEDPNGNGLADEVPMSGFIGGWALILQVWMINSFVQCNNPLSNTNPTVAAGLVVNDGKIEYSVMKDEYREALRYINGCIPKDFWILRPLHRTIHSSFRNSEERDASGSCFTLEAALRPMMSSGAK